MDTWVWIVIAVFVAVVVIGILVSALGTRRTVDKTGGRREAEDGEAGRADQVSNRDRDLADVHAHDNVERLR